DLATAADSVSVGVGVAGASVGVAAGTIRTTADTGAGDPPITAVVIGGRMHIAVGAGVVMAAMDTAIIREPSSLIIAIWRSAHLPPTVLIPAPHAHRRAALRVRRCHLTLARAFLPVRWLPGALGIWVLGAAHAARYARVQPRVVRGTQKAYAAAHHGGPPDKPYVRRPIPGAHRAAAFVQHGLLHRVPAVHGRLVRQDRAVPDLPRLRGPVASLLPGRPAA